MTIRVLKSTARKTVPFSGIFMINLTFFQNRSCICGRDSWFRLTNARCMSVAKTVCIGISNNYCYMQVPFCKYQFPYSSKRMPYGISSNWERRGEEEEKNMDLGFATSRSCPVFQIPRAMINAYFNFKFAIRWLCQKYPELPTILLVQDCSPGADFCNIGGIIPVMHWSVL